MQEMISDDANIRIGGVEIQYYYTCHRELWFKIHQIVPYQDDNNISIGRQIHSDTYSRHKKREIALGPVKIDIVKGRSDPKIVEIKKSSKLLKPTVRQLQYYLLLLSRQGIHISGEVRIPKEKKIIPVTLDQEIKDELENTIDDIQIIAELSKPPEYREKPYCKQCGYREICKV